MYSFFFYHQFCTINMYLQIVKYTHKSFLLSIVLLLIYFTLRVILCVTVKCHLISLISIPKMIQLLFEESFGVLHCNSSNPISSLDSAFRESWFPTMESNFKILIWKNFVKRKEQSTNFHPTAIHREIDKQKLPTEPFLTI